MQSENMLDLLVMWILRTQPVRSVYSDVVPQPVCQIRVEFHVGMESVATLDHCMWVSSFNQLSLKDLHGWEVIVDNIEVFELIFVDYLSIDFAEILGPLSCELTNCFIAIQPSPAWTYLKAVQEIIDCLVSYVKRVDVSMQVVIK